MSAGTVEVIDERKSLERLNDALGEYLLTTKRTPGQELARRTPFISQALFRGFMAITPKRTEILAEAKARGWKMGREDKANSIRGISLRALARVADFMGAEKSVLVSSSQEDSGERIFLKAVRMRKRGYGKRLYGRHSERKGVAVPGTGLGNGGAQAIYGAGYKVLNRRAVAVAMEINLRQQGRRFLGVSWLHRRWRKLSQADAQQTGAWRILDEITNPRSRFNPLGGAELVSDGNGGAFLHMTSNVPGMEKPFAQVVINRVLDDEATGLEAVILKKSVENLDKEIGSL